MIGRGAFEVGVTQPPRQDPVGGHLVADHRARLDTGILGVVGVTVSNAAQAVGLLRGAHANGVRVLTTREIEVTADAPEIPVGIDGEAVRLPTPVRCTIRPGALRVWVPRHRPGVPRPKPEMNWNRLRQLAFAR